MYRLLTLILFLITASVSAQVVRLSALDSLPPTRAGRVAVGAYVDTYYGYNFSKPADGYNPYFVSSARHNEININLAYVDVRYRSQSLRARFAPGVGTYMDANYKAEPGTLKHIVEANVGVRLSERRNIWLDMGVLTSPFTNESAISRDHLMYTRSFAPENVPYYLAGARLTVPVSEKVTAYGWFINGWQIIQDYNTGKSVATQLEYRPNARTLINWNTYTGDERSPTHPEFRTRFFNDVYLVYKGDGALSFTSSVYYGVQQRAATTAAHWWQANIIGRMAFTQKVSVSGRVEYFHDPDAVMLSSINGAGGVRTYSSGLCVNVKVQDNALFRLEARRFFSPDHVYTDGQGAAARNSMLLVASLTGWF